MGGWLACRLKAGDAVRADLRAVPYPGGQDHAIARRKVDVAPNIGQHEADGATHAVQHLFVAVAMHGVAIIRSVRPRIRGKTVLLHTASQIALGRRRYLRPTNNLYIHSNSPTRIVSRIFPFSILYDCKAVMKYSETTC